MAASSLGPNGRALHRPAAKYHLTQPSPAYTYTSLTGSYGTLLVVVVVVMDDAVDEGAIVN
jgi:hypothetical protein